MINRYNINYNVLVTAIAHDSKLNSNLFCLFDKLQVKLTSLSDMQLQFSRSPKTSESLGFSRSIQAWDVVRGFFVNTCTYDVSRSISFGLLNHIFLSNLPHKYTKYDKVDLTLSLKNCISKEAKFIYMVRNLGTFRKNPHICVPRRILIWRHY